MAAFLLLGSMYVWVDESKRVVVYITSQASCGHPEWAIANAPCCICIVAQ